MEKMLKDLNKKMDSMLEKHDEVLGQLSTHTEQINRLEENNVRLSNELKQLQDKVAEQVKESLKLQKENQSLKNNLKELNEKVEDVTKRIKINEETVTSNSGRIKSVEIFEKNARKKYHELSSRADDMEDRSKRQNLIFYGLEEQQNEDVETRVQDVLINRKLMNDQVHIDRAHRIGKKSPGKHRPVVVRFTYYKDKEWILSQAKLLKGSPIKISEQYSKATLTINRELFEACKVAKSTDGRIKGFFINYRYARLIYGDGAKKTTRNFNIDAINKSDTWYDIKF